MITAPARFRQLLPAAVVAVALATGANTVAYPAIAGAEDVWDIEDYDDCMDRFAWMQFDQSINEQKGIHEACCELSGGVFIDDGYVGKCVAPPAEPAGTRRQIPSDIATAPVVTQEPPRTIPPDIATAPTVTAP